MITLPDKLVTVTRAAQRDASCKPVVVPREIGKVLPEAQPISNGVKACNTSN